MFEEVMGIPAHPLLVHAPVVFVPLLAVLSIGYAFVPLVRPHIRWVLGLLALATPVATGLAKLSGDAFFDRLADRDRISPEFLPRLEEHQDFGTLTLYATIVLSVVTLILVYLVRPGGSGGSDGTAGHAAARTTAARAVPVVLGLLSLAAAVASVYYVVRTGDSGASAVWEGA